MADHDSLELAADRIGRQLVESSRVYPWRARWWNERLMAWMMSHPSLRLQAFRFIDVLPTLSNRDAIAGHLAEYLGEVERPPLVARIVERSVAVAPGPVRRLVAGLARWSAARMARTFIAGADLSGVLATTARLRRRGWAVSLDALGEVVVSDSEADRHLSDYEDAIGRLASEMSAWPEREVLDRDALGPIPRLSLAVKLSSLSGRFHPIDRDGTTRDVLSRLRPLLRTARAAGVQVYVDMENHQVKDLVFHIVCSVLEEPEFADWRHVGVALQAYLSEAESDLERLLEWSKRRGTPIWVRLVKGAYWDYETITAAASGWPVPVYSEKWQSDASFERLAERLMKNSHWLKPALGSHNLRSLAWGIACAEAHSVPKGDWEVQVLYGMADPLAGRLAELGYRVRVYAPFGDWLPGMAYLVRRLLENTSNESFLRAGASRGVDTSELLKVPGPSSLEPGGVDWRVVNNQHDCAASSGTEEVEMRFTNEPLSDFSRSEPRERLGAALDDVERLLGREWPVDVSGRRLSGELLVSENPSQTSETVGTVARATAEDAAGAVRTAAEAASAWSGRSVQERAGCLRRAAELMRGRRFELAAWMILECGKPWAEADADVAEAIDFCEYYAGEALEMSGGLRMDVPGETNWYGYRPRGVVSVISPWNFPLAIPTGMTVAALVTGNTVVLKPAEQSSVIGVQLAEILYEAGVPREVLQLVPGIGEEVGPVLVGHPDVRMVAFTGSREVGLAINRQAADVVEGDRGVRRVIAEMGGKNAIIIDSDADLDVAVSGVVSSAFAYAGQKCSACSRAIVLESIHDEFVERLIEATRSLVVGPAKDPATSVGPVIDAESRQRIERAVLQGGLRAREALAVDVGELATAGHFVGPRVFVDVKPSDALARDELFGPVLVVLKVGNLDEAIRVANGTDYALTGGIFSRSPASLDRARRELEVGNLYLNREITGALVGRHPFGGYRYSGIGSKAGGPDYLGQFVVPVHVTENTLRQGFAVDAPGRTEA